MSSLYLKDDLDPAVSAGALVSLDGDEARHAIQVSRIRVGERLLISNGDGTRAEGVVDEIVGKTLSMRVERVTTSEPKRPQLWLAQGLAKGDRDERAIQAATELGVSGVIPWAASRSVSRWDGPKRAKGEERWRAIVREASKQSIRSFVPEVLPLHSTKELATLAGASRMLVLDPRSDASLRAVPSGAASGELPAVDSIIVVVGPEGGISDAECEQLERAGAERVKLGDEILRTSTAGPAALAVINLMLGRW